jgi:hypothetical protein
VGDGNTEQAAGGECGPHYVYIIETRSRPTRVKVGESADPESRLRNLQTGSPETLRLDSTWIPLATQAEAKELERRVHVSLGRLGYHVRGEWFDCDAALAAKVAVEVVFREYVLDQNDGVYRRTEG